MRSSFTGHGDQITDRPSFFFGSIPREMATTLTDKSFQLRIDDKEREFIAVGAPLDSNGASGLLRVYDALFIRAFKLYMEKRDPRCQAFFQKVCDRRCDKTSPYYMNHPMTKSSYVENHEIHFKERKVVSQIQPLMCPLLDDRDFSQEQRTQRSRSGQTPTAERAHLSLEQTPQTERSCYARTRHNMRY